MNRKLKQKLPSSIESEMATIGSMMLSNSAIDGVLGILSESSFFDPRHKVLFRNLVRMRNENKPIDLVLLTQHLAGEGELGSAGGAEWVSEVFIYVPTPANWREYASIVREKELARRVIDIANRMLESSYDPGQESGIAQVAQDAIAEVSSFFQSKAETKHIREVLARRLDYYETKAGAGKIEGLPTGIAPLDKAMRGLRPGNMITIAAETKGGKTALAMNIASNVALNGAPVGLFSLEMGEGELADRLISAHACVDLAAITDGGLPASDVRRVLSSINELSKADIFIRDESVLTPLQFRSAARMLVTRHKCQLLIVDYLQLMTPSGTDENRERQVADCSRTIKTTAAELGVPIIILSQLNEKGRSRESRAIENDSNIFAVIEEENGQTYINLKLTRDCPRGRIPVTFRREYTRFEEVPPSDCD